MFTHYLLLTVGFALTLVTGLSLRLQARALWKTDPSDAWSHGYYARLIQLHKSIPRYVDRIIPHTECSYPWGVAWAISKFNIDWDDPRLTRVGSLFNICISSADIILVSLACSIVSHHIGHSFEISLQTGVVGALIMAVLPQPFSPWSGLIGLNARPLGAMLTNVGAISMCLATVTESNFWWLAISSTAFSLILLTSKFGVQAWLVAMATIALASGSIGPVISTLVGLLLGIIVTKGKALRILAGHIAHSIFYARTLQFRHTGTVKKCWPFSVFLVRALKGFPNTSVFTAIYSTPLLRATLLNPWILCLIPIWMSLNSDIPLIRTLLWTATVSVIAIPVISTPGLRFLGEPDRYLMFQGTYATIILTSPVLSDTVSSAAYWILTGGLLATSLMLSIVFIKTRSRIRHNVDYGPEHEVARFLNEQSKRNSGPIVLCVPTTITQKLIPICHASFVGLYLNAPLSLKRQKILDEIYTENFPYPKADVETLAESLGVCFIVYSSHHCDPSYLLRNGLDPAVVLPFPTPESIEDLVCRTLKKRSLSEAKDWA